MITGNGGRGSNGLIQSMEIQWVSRRGRDGASNQNVEYIGLDLGEKQVIRLSPTAAAQHYNNALNSANQIANQIRAIDRSADPRQWQSLRSELIKKHSGEQRMMATLRGE